jgi:hypothetical protein
VIREESKTDTVFGFPVAYFRSSQRRKKKRGIALLDDAMFSLSQGEVQECFAEKTQPREDSSTIQRSVKKQSKNLNGK